MKKLLENKILAGILIGALIALTTGIFSGTKIFQSWHLKLADSLYTENKPSDEIVIIAIDEQSTRPAPDGLGRFSEWTRQNYTDLLKQIAKEKPKVIGFDILFHTPTQTLPTSEISKLKYSLPENSSNQEKLQAYENFVDENSNPLSNKIDLEFAEQLGKFTNTVLIFNSNQSSSLSPTYPLKRFTQTAAIGDAHITLNPDGVLRKKSTTFHDSDKNEIYDDFATAIAKKYLKKDVINLPLESNKLTLNFFAEPFGFKMLPFAQVMKGDYPADTFKNKIVLIGVTSFSSLQDTVITPRSSEVAMAGIEVHANEIQTIIEQKFLKNQGILSQILTVALIAMLATVVLNYLSIALSVIFTLLAIAAYVLAAHFFFKQGLILNMIHPFVAIILAFIASYVYKYFITDSKKRQLKNAFGHYVSSDLVDQISKNPEMVKLGGEKRIVTVLFSDLKNSTGLSELTEITSWVEQINEYFTVMEEIVKQHGGTIDKFEGDALIAFWNAPILQNNHTEMAYQAALKMQQALKDLNEKWLKEDQNSEAPRPQLAMRIGVNTGEVIVGNFGSKNRFDYTVMGDTVNAASRLESWACKEYKKDIVVANFPAGLNSKFKLTKLDSTTLPGKTTATTLYSLEN